MPEESGWIGTKEAAERLGVVTRTLYRMIDKGELAGYLFGRVIRVRESDLDDFIDKCRIKPGDLKHLYTPLEPIDSDDTPDSGT